MSHSDSRQNLPNFSNLPTNLHNLFVPTNLNQNNANRQRSTESVGAVERRGSSSTTPQKGKSKLELHRSISSNACFRKYDVYDARPPPNMKFRTQIRGGNKYSGFYTLRHSKNYLHFRHSRCLVVVR